MMYGNSFFNTKQGVSKSNLRYQSIPGDIYIAAFTKVNTRLSKTREELELENLQIKPVAQRYSLQSV